MSETWYLAGSQRFQFGHMVVTELSKEENTFSELFRGRPIAIAVIGISLSMGQAIRAWTSLMDGRVISWAISMKPRSKCNDG